MNFFEKELHKLFPNGKLMESIYFEANACVGTLGRDFWIRARFISTFATVRYDALEIVVLDRLTQSAITTPLKFENIWRNKHIFVTPDLGWRICPDIRTCPAKEEEYPFTEDDREKLRNAVRQSLQPFLEQVSEPERNDLQLVYICAPFRGDVTKNIEFARQRAREVFLAGEFPVCPHLMFPPIANPKNPSEDQATRDMGLRLVALCQQINVYGACTAGMQGEINLAQKLNIPIKYFKMEGKQCRVTEHW